MTPRLVLITASSLDEARKIAQTLLQPRLAACMNIMPGVESHYWWQGKLERGSEVLLLIKTSAEQFEAVAAAVRRSIRTSVRKPWHSIRGKLRRPTRLGGETR